MRRALPPLLLAVLLVVAAAPAGGKDAQPCADKGSKTVRSSSEVRVYYSKDGVLHGCLRKSGLTRELYRPTSIPNEYNSVSLVQIAGHRVAFQVTSICTVCGDGGPEAAIHAVNLDNGQSRVLTPVRGRPKGSYLGRWVDALVVDRCGRIAYRAVLTRRWDDQHRDPELHTWAGGVRRRVDRGAIVRSSIRLERSSVHWRRDGEKRSAPLLPAC
jgi:hypothetical protein